MPILREAAGEKRRVVGKVSDALRVCRGRRDCHCRFSLDGETSALVIQVTLLQVAPFLLFWRVSSLLSAYLGVRFFLRRTIYTLLTHSRNE